MQSDTPTRHAARTAGSRVANRPGKKAASTLWRAARPCKGDLRPAAYLVYE